MGWGASQQCVIFGCNVFFFWQKWTTFPRKKISLEKVKHIEVCFGEKLGLHIPECSKYSNICKYSWIFLTNNIHIHICSQKKLQIIFNNKNNNKRFIVSDIGCTLTSVQTKVHWLQHGGLSNYFINNLVLISFWLQDLNYFA